MSDLLGRLLKQVVTLLCFSLFLDIADGGNQSSKSTIPFYLSQNGSISAGIMDGSGKVVQQLISGQWMASGNHSITLPLGTKNILQSAPPPHRLVVINNAGVSYKWEGVLGNTGPLNGPGALKGLNPPAKIVVVGEQAMWCLGYNERQPGCFVFNLTNPQVSEPVTSPNFERVGHS